MGPARYGDLNSDLPVCITQEFLLIQSVTSLQTGNQLRTEYYPALYIEVLIYIQGGHEPTWSRQDVAPIVSTLDEGTVGLEIIQY